MWILHNKKKIQLKKTMKSNLNREGTKTCNLSKIYAKFHCFKEFNLHHYLCFIIVQHPCANKRNIISILLFFYIRIYWIHTDKNILLITLKWTNSSCSRLSSMYLERDGQIYWIICIPSKQTGQWPYIQEPSHPNLNTLYLRFLKDKKEKLNVLRIFILTRFSVKKGHGICFWLSIVVIL